MTIAFELPASGHALVEIFDVRGRLIRRLLDQALPAGSHSRSWDGKDNDGATVQSGVYFYRLTAGGQSQAKKMIILK
ncbi:MAG TPA: FlgD immunoglobulin-like domain containing protein [Candidatus Krumholzibacteria bacterium]|nr:FlgD immunoglobulin-like domain containing protein [Candidatus Krumholzibacteria bacterium]